MKEWTFILWNTQTLQEVTGEVWERDSLHARQEVMNKYPKFHVIRSVEPKCDHCKHYYE